MHTHRALTEIKCRSCNLGLPEALEGHILSVTGLLFSNSDPHGDKVAKASRDA